MVKVEYWNLDSHFMNEMYYEVYNLLLALGDYYITAFERESQ